MRVALEGISYVEGIDLKAVELLTKLELEMWRRWDRRVKNDKK